MDVEKDVSAVVDELLVKITSPVLAPEDNRTKVDPLDDGAVTVEPLVDLVTVEPQDDTFTVDPQQGFYWRQNRSLVPYGAGSSSEADSEPDSDSSTEDSESDSSSSSSESSSSDSNNVIVGDASSDSDDVHDIIDRNKPGPQKPPQTKRIVRTKGEMTLDDLPPIKDLHITIQKHETVQIGNVHAIVDKLVIVQSLQNSPALDLDSILLLEDGTALGEVYDVLGQVVKPLYAVRFNTIEAIRAKDIKIGDVVCFAPGRQDLTSFIFLEQLQRMKGSDASWKDNNEPPDTCLDFSDDEQERAARGKGRGRAQRKAEDNNGGEGVPPKVPRRGGRGRRRGFGVGTPPRQHYAGETQPGGSPGSVQSSAYGAHDGHSHSSQSPSGPRTNPFYMRPRYGSPHPPPTYRQPPRYGRMPNPQFHCNVRPPGPPFGMQFRFDTTTFMRPPNPPPPPSFFSPQFPARFRSSAQLFMPSPPPPPPPPRPFP